MRKPRQLIARSEGGPMRRFRLLLALLIAVASISLAQEMPRAKASTGPSEVKVGGEVSMPFTVTLEDMKKMPRKTLRIENTRAKKTDVYEGVPLAALLQKAGAPQGEQIRGAAMVTYVLVDAADDYRVIFSLAEIDAAFLNSEILLADTLDGAPLAPDQGPFKLVAPHEKRPARWIKMVKSITVGRVGN
jgi:DMSO/TMAO reductase YedYZ molybdopterin-dependent catalytic subunit